MNALYNILLYLAAPIAFAVQLWRGLKNRAYWERLSERFGYTTLRFAQAPIWIHAVSVGEVQAAAPLIRRLLDDDPQSSLLITTGTVTGAARVRELFRDKVRHGYLPYDLPGSVARFLAVTQPCAALVLETELWPNLFRACVVRGIPLILVSARISPRTAARYRKLRSLFLDSLPKASIAAQTAADAERFHDLGADPKHVVVTGNLKFDLEISEEVRTAGGAWRSLQAAQRPVWIAGSTREGEEPQLLAAHRQILAALPDALLILAPRHPQRFAQVKSLLQSEGLSFVARSSGIPLEPRSQVLLLDTLGELTQFYAASDVAFVGGSLVPVGGHNLLEPAALGLAVLSGPSTFNAQDIARQFFEGGAALRVHSAGELATVALRLLRSSDEREAIGRKALALITDNRGALERTIQLIRGAMTER